MKKSTLLFSLLLATTIALGQPTEYAVMVSATAQENPPKLTFSWPEDINASWYHIFRKTKTDTSWGDPIAVLDGSATQFIDTDLEVGEALEYGFYKTLNRFYDSVVIANGTNVTFTISDSWNDGMCCHHGLGSYAVTGANQVYTSGGDFGAQESTSFTVDGGGATTEDLVTISMLLDVYGEETSWELVNDGTGAVLLSGGPYEYHKYGHTYSGIKVPFVESRGGVLLLVDHLFINSLAEELLRLEADLICDGWKVTRMEIGRNSEVTVVKEKIVNACLSDTTINTVFLFGHIPVPYSGNIMSAHSEHCGAYPADIYYAELDDEWTDLYVNNTTASRPENHNVPGDGKFDNTFLESGVDLQIGRVDLYDMPSFPGDETYLLGNYLDKNHNFRYGIFQAERRGLIDDNVGALGGLAPCATGLRYFSSMFGAENIHAVDFFNTLQYESYLWSQGVGGGSYTSCGGVGTTNDFATKTVLSVFTMLYGSYFGDWDNTDNILRAPLAAAGMPLTCCWAGAPVWDLHHMALGETIGYSTLITQNNINLYAPADRAYQVPTALMGDPTLRLHMVIPASGLEATAGTNSATLTWNPSPDAIEGYHIFRAETLRGDFTRITTDPVSGIQYTDPSPSPGNNVYMVRALKLETSGSGTYYNLSQGVIDSVDVVIDVEQVEPEEHGQMRIYPNPSNEDCTIQFTLSHPDQITLSLLSTSGIQIRDLLSDAKKQAGKHTATWDGRDASGSIVEPGVYYIQLTNKSGISTLQKLVKL
ncbi:T9SS type A sorting domain-containing protein [Bacteroidota bacterium]